MAGGTAAWAHQDPGTCGQTGVSQQLAIFRADGTTLVGSGTVTECETIVFQATLAKPGGSTVCAFQGGTWTLQIANRAPIVLSASVPCIGGTTGGCDPTVTQIVSSPVSITVAAGDF